MRSSTTLAILCSALATAQDLPQAEPVNDNPVATVYKATLPEEPFFTAGSLDGNVKGSFVASTTDDGLSVRWKVELSNLPSEGGPFSKLCPQRVAVLRLSVFMQTFSNSLI